jgi:Domain of unknown function (DUF4861)
MSRRNLIPILSLAALALAGPLSSQTNNEIFEKMIGPQARMDPAVTAEVLKSQPGTKARLDTDGDGRIDTIYFVDNDDRHSPARQPMLVKVVDEDGDMWVTGEGDLDSDLYIADWNGDGTVDRVVDYIDTDHDNAVDEEVQYRWHDDLKFRDDTWDSLQYNGRAYSAFWSKDVGHDHRLAYERDYEYFQEATQWKSDFNGSEVDVYSYLYDFKANFFVPGWENPFCFYDNDGDSRADEVVRLTGNRNVSRNLRYSMDLDNADQGTQRHGYDMSITALGPIRYGEQDCERHTMRGIPTGPVIAWEKARALAKAANWSKAHLTFNENHNNIDPTPGANHNERWEGVLNTPNDYFPQVGGPPCGPFNKRNEVDSDNSGGFRFYRSPVDRRWHLFGAEVGWIKTDFNYDGQPEMEIRFEDTDVDGFFDLWRYDLDGDGKFEREYKLADDRAYLIPFGYDALREAYMSELPKIVEENQRLIEVLKAALAKLEPGFAVDEVEEYFSKRLVPEYDQGFGLGAKIKNSLAGTRYYGDLIRERYFLRLLKAGPAKVACLDEVTRSYVSGDYALAAAVLEGKFLKEGVRRWLSPYTKRFGIEVDNPGERRLDSRPFVLRVADIRREIPDFNERNFVLAEAEPRIDWREIPSQVDDLDGDGKGDELVWVKTLLPGEKTKLWCYYTPGGAAQRVYPPRTDAAMDWDKGTLANIGWESEKAAYRLYYGQIEAFGKKSNGNEPDRLILADLGKSKSSYHNMQDWGMDVLHVGNASGLGGLSIWEDGNRLPLVIPGGKGDLQIRRSIVARGPVRSLARVEFSGLKGKLGEYRVRLDMSAFAGNPYSRQEVTVWSPDGKEVVYGPGLQKLAHDDWFALSASGVLASWGNGYEGAGDIGLGVMYRPEEYAGFAEGEFDRYIKLRAPSGQARAHWIYGDWRKGFPNPTAPTARDWALRVEDLALQLRSPVTVRIVAR